MSSQQTHNVVTTLQRRCNVTTLQRRCNDVDATLCVCRDVSLCIPDTRGINRLSLHDMESDKNEPHSSWETCLLWRKRYTEHAIHQIGRVKCK